MDSIIVYRNPAEAALWETLMSANGFLFISALVVFIVSVCLFGSWIEKAQARWGVIRKFNKHNYLPIWVAIAVTVLYLHHMWI